MEGEGEENIVEVHRGEDNDWKSVPWSPLFVFFCSSYFASILALRALTHYSTNSSTTRDGWLKPNYMVFIVKILEPNLISRAIVIEIPQTRFLSGLSVVPTCNHKSRLYFEWDEGSSPYLAHITVIYCSYTKEKQVRYMYKKSLV